MNEKRNVKLRDALLKAIAIAAFTAVPATAIAPVAQARVLLDEVNNGTCNLGDDDTGDGSADSPYRISTVEDLAEITDCNYYDDSEAYYVLTNDLDITPDDNYNNDGFEWNGTDDGWIPIGNYVYENVGDPGYFQDDFEGNFDGQGHTITGLTIDNSDISDDYMGLFGQTYDAVIKNLHIVGADIDAGDGDYNDYVGILVGGDYDSVITNVHVDGDVYDSDEYTGGIVGGTWGTRISKSSSSGTLMPLDDGDTIGGIVGGADWGFDQTRLTYVSSSMQINDEDNLDENYYQVGGIVGDADDWTIINHATFSGSVFGEDDLGGIVGSFYGGLVHDAVVTEDALVITTDSDDADNIGGIAGYSDSGTFSNVVFAGTLDADNQGDYEVNNVGGIIGNADDTNIVSAHVTSTAEISVRGYDGGDIEDNGSYNLGGILGYADDVTVTSSVNDADLEANDIAYVGGIVGQADSSNINHSVNRGFVHVTLSDPVNDWDEAAVGGIVGYLDYGSEVSNSTNKGDVDAGDGADYTWAVGGIAGYVDWASVLDNYNTGDVTAVCNIGGVAGWVDNAQATVSRNYNLGKLVGYDCDPDGIADVDTDDDHSDSSNAVLLSDAADNAWEAMELTVALLKDGSDLVDAGWSLNVDGGYWATDVNVNNGFPYLTWESGTDEIDEPVQLSDTEFEPFTIPGGKRFRLNVAEKNYLNSIIDVIKANPYTEVDLDVYYGSKERLAGKRAKSVKRWLVSQGVAVPISIHILPEDGSYDRGSIVITALVD